jgi:hypothetical protein
MNAPDAGRPHFTDDADPDTECAECGHTGRGLVPGCSCGEGTDSRCDDR